jgi:hypothetical protein
MVQYYFTNTVTRRVLTGLVRLVFSLFTRL